MDTEATGSASLAAFNSATGSNKIIQANWTGISGTTGNTIDGPDVDVRIDHTVGGVAASTSTAQNYNTSTAGNGYQWSGTNGQQVSILFGTQDGSFSNDRTVKAAGLVLLNFGSVYTDVTITYLDPGDNVLSTQNFVGGADSQTPGSWGGADFFTGYVSPSQNIAKVTIDLTSNAGNSDIALDAVTYVAGPAVISTDPADDATEVPVDTNLTATFSSPVVAAAGTIEIRESADDSLFADFAATSSSVSITGDQVVINPASDLADGTEYYVLMPAGTFEDTSGNGSAGITVPGNWSFTTSANAGGSLTADFDPTGDYAAQFSNALYSEAVSSGLNGSTAIALDNLAVSSFDLGQAPLLAANTFVDGASFTVGTFFNASSFSTTGDLLRLGLTNGGTDNYAFLPFVTIELTASGARFVIRGGGTNEPIDPVFFTLQTGQWYYFEVTFTRTGNGTNTAIDYDASIAEASSDGTIGALLRNYQALGQTGGLGGDGSELNKAIYGGFKGHMAFPGSAAVIDNFYASSSGLTQLPESIPPVLTPPDLKVIGVTHTGGALEIDIDGFDTFKQYLLKRTTDLSTGFPTVIGEPFTPLAETGTMSDPAPPAGSAYYRIEEAPAPRPNIVVILMDDLGYNDIGVQTWPSTTNYYPNSGPTPKPNIASPDPDIPEPNEARLLTPKIDAMAAQGIRLTSFYASSKCSPTRASLMTGRYDRRVDVNYVFWPDGRNGGGLNTHEITLPEALREAGYATSLVGKWHLGYQIAAHSPFQLMPRRHGYEEFYGLPHSNGMTDLALIENETVLDPDFSTPGEQAQLTWRYTERALEFINRQTAADTPFFLVLSHTMPHIPVYPSDQTYANSDGSTWPQFAGASGVSSYYDIVMETDHSVDRILSRLSALGIDDETIVIFTSDNGPWLRLSPMDLLAQSVGSAYPLRDSKLTTWEGGCRVPFIARWPGVIPAGVVSDETVGMVDLFPTIVGLAGGSRPHDRTLDGVNLLPLLTNEAGWTQPRDQYALFEQNTGTLGAVIKDQYKLRAGKLYNLATDIQESTDLAGSEPAKLAELQAAAAAVNASIAADSEPRGVFTSFEVQLSTDGIAVPEGGTATFQVRLSADPGGNITVNTNIFSGDTDLSTTSGGSLSFGSGNWSAWQTVTLTAAPDADSLNSGATFRVSSPQINAVREVFATEVEP
ncbi:MAG: sulfatase-like hydrolase/transferase [Verrucomicrobia bacterium]|nr:sulfatase-like hydrolase/transferase [Verrucomicrobiota bacterium]